MIRQICLLTALGVLIADRLSLAETPSGSRPDIVLIMVDDLGFSDLGCYGSEIPTPHLDQLANAGIRFTQFYNCAKCETTRATLLSGKYHHQVKIARLQNCQTIAEHLRPHEYRTLMTGKWHMDRTPLERGFQRYFGHLSGATNFFTGDDTFLLDDQPFSVPANGFYTTDANVDYALEFLNASPLDQPLFLYVAFNAPHYPLQAPQSEVEKYRGKYKIGWDEIRQQRFQRQRELGLFDAKVTPANRPEDVPAWNSLDAQQQDTQDLMMATYAGMIDRLDQAIGRLVAGLKDRGNWDNTLLIFLSDNGACPFQRTKPETLAEKRLPWSADSYWTYDKGWAHACNTPFREYKQNQHEGGTRTPFFLHWPQQISAKGTVVTEPAHLIDILPTLLDVATSTTESTDPSTTGATHNTALPGISLIPALQGKWLQRAEPLFFTFYGKNNAIRFEQWKLVSKDFGPWELYDLSNDPTELNDIATSHPDIVSRMSHQWETWARETDVVRRKPK